MTDVLYKVTYQKVKKLSATKLSPGAGKWKLHSWQVADEEHLWVMWVTDSPKRGRAAGSS